MGAKKRIVILISGRGSNMQALVEADIAQAEIVAVISNRADAAGLLWAAQHVHWIVAAGWQAVRFILSLPSWIAVRL